MELLKSHSKEKELIKNTSPKKSSKKIKHKKKSKKIKSEKHYKNLKELLEDIKQEKKLKSTKEVKKDETKKEDEKLIKDFYSIYNKSNSETTFGSLSQDEINNVISTNDFELKTKSNYILKNYYEINEGILYKEKSYIYEYYKGFDEILKNDKELNEIVIGLNKSKNFIKKSFFINNNKEKIEIKEKKEINNNNYNNNTKSENKFNIGYNLSDNSNIKIPMYNYNYIDYYNCDFNSNKNNDIQNIINNINNNMTKNYYLFPYNKNFKNQKGINKAKNKKENFSKIRKGNGDWTYPQSPIPI